jgi:hypothetical protein
MVWERFRRSRRDKQLQVLLMLVAVCVAAAYVCVTAAASTVTVHVARHTTLMQSCPSGHYVFPSAARIGHGMYVPVLLTAGFFLLEW